ncbi:hypothetical protein FRC01_001744 [Tulasnella sp. 417]|nr:hypothetical protein FRC01_001744 [Tulasnella sp. 417]
MAGKKKGKGRKPTKKGGTKVVSKSNQPETQEEDERASDDDVPQHDLGASSATPNAGNQLPAILETESTQGNQQEGVVETLDASAREGDIKLLSSKPPTALPPAEVAATPRLERSGSSKSGQQYKQKDISTTTGNAVQQGDLTAPSSSNHLNDGRVQRGTMGPSSTYAKSASAEKQKSVSIAEHHGSNLEYRPEDAVQALDYRSTLSHPGASSSTNPTGEKSGTPKLKANPEAQRSNQEDKRKDTSQPFTNGSLQMGPVGVSSVYPGGSQRAEATKQKDTSHHSNDSVRQMVSAAPKGETPTKQLPPEPGPTPGTQEPCYRDNHGDVSSTSDFDYPQRYMAGSSAQPIGVSTGKLRYEVTPEALKPNEEDKRKAPPHAVYASAEPNDPTRSSSSNPKDAVTGKQRLEAIPKAQQYSRADERKKSSTEGSERAHPTTWSPENRNNPLRPTHPGIAENDSHSIRAPGSENEKMAPTKPEAPKSSRPQKQDDISKTHNEGSLQKSQAPPPVVPSRGETTRKHKVEGSPEPQKPNEGDKPKDYLQTVDDGSLKRGMVAYSSADPRGEKSGKQKSDVNPEAQKPNQGNKPKYVSEPFDNGSLEMDATGSSSVDPRGKPGAAAPPEFDQEDAPQPPNDNAKLRDPAASSSAHSKGAATRKQTMDKPKQGHEGYKPNPRDEPKNSPDPPNDFGKQGAQTGSDRMEGPFRLVLAIIVLTLSQVIGLTDPPAGSQASEEPVSKTQGARQKGESKVAPRDYNSSGWHEDTNLAAFGHRPAESAQQDERRTSSQARHNRAPEQGSTTPYATGPIGSLACILAGIALIDGQVRRSRRNPRYQEPLCPKEEGRVLLYYLLKEIEIQGNMHAKLSLKEIYVLVVQRRTSQAICYGLSSR